DIKPAVPAVRGSDEAPPSRFAGQPAVAYQTAQGELVFALQLQPKLDPAARRPRDLLILVDTSASQAARGLVQARALAAAPPARPAAWTATPPAYTRDLSRGFQAPAAEPLKQALKTLEETEYPAGACDLKNGLEKVTAAFEQADGRQQVLVFLGDGESALR